MDLGRRQNLDHLWFITPEFKAALIGHQLPTEAEVSVKLYRDAEDHFTLWFEFAGIPIMVAQGAALDKKHQVEIRFPKMQLDQLLDEEGQVPIL